MEYVPAYELHVKMSLAQRPDRCFPDCRERFRKQCIERLTAGKTLTEGRRESAERLRRKGPHRFFVRIDRLDNALRFPEERAFSRKHGIQTEHRGSHGNTKRITH